MKVFKALWVVLVHLLVIALFAIADEGYPPPGWSDKVDPLASPDAVPGGEITAYAGQYPESLNYYLANNTFVADVFSAMYETLLELDPITAEYVPGVAKRWNISSDKRTFTFWLDEHARWSDGRPITAEDVRWTFDAIMNPANLTGAHKVSLETFEPPTVVSTNCIRFHASEVHWRNLGAAGGFHILPKHVFDGMDFNKINFEFPVVSGAYQLGELKEGVLLTFERRPDWWRRYRKSTRYVANFQTIRYRFFSDAENAFEAFKKGLLDIYPVYISRLWVKETAGEKFDKNWIVKQRIENHQPMGFQGFAMNMRRTPFDDLRVRRAMAHLLDREKMNRTLMYSQYFMHRSYFEDLYSPEHPCQNTVYEFDKEKARKLLAEAGWRVNQQTGLLEKNGRPFSFCFLSHDASSEKFLAIYAEDLKDVGIRMKIERKDWAAWAKDMDEFNFDMTWVAWSEGLFKDPEGMWHSKEAKRRGGNNITGFQDPGVDELIEKQKAIFDVAKRNEIYRQIDAIIAPLCPYALLWNINATRLLYWNKFGTPPTVLSKYGDERSAFWYWWLDEDSVAELNSAMRRGAYLPVKKPVIKFDEEFGKQR
ncbi:MAG: extracellular solute-binding protein [Kiritimatiellia bacterium]